MDEPANHRQHGGRNQSTLDAEGRPVLLRRLAQLYAGLALYGASMALMIHADLGLDPWDVFHQGLSQHLHLSFGTITIITGAAVLVLWIPLRQRPGLGTVSNVLVIGLAVDATSAVLPSPRGLLIRAVLLVSGIVLNALAGGAYIGAGFGPGPRDGLMTGLHRRTGGSLRVIRTGIEVSVLLLGVLLGGTVGVGTVAYALSIGPLVQFFLRRLSRQYQRREAVPSCGSAAERGRPGSPMEGGRARPAGGSSQVPAPEGEPQHVTASRP
jgi:uncharacterized membrane protein YczE